MWQLAPVDAAAGDLKKQVGNVIKSLTAKYRFQTLGEYRALLSLYNIGVEKVEGENHGHQYTGLVYSALDAEDNRVGKPLKSSLFGKSYGFEALEQKMKKSGEEIKTQGTAAASIRAAVAAPLAEARTGGEFRAQLRVKGIDIVLRYGNGNRLFGVTFIDRNSRIVINGSALGKEFSANALSARFADFAMASREDLKPATPVPLLAVNDKDVPATVSPIIRSVSDDRLSDSLSATPDMSPIGDAAGSLFSILTPEPDGQSNDSQPKRIRPKKKKRKYGRQM